MKIRKYFNKYLEIFMGTDLIPSSIASKNMQKNTQNNFEKKKVLRN
jgi:hypothetical protein